MNILQGVYSLVNWLVVSSFFFFFLLWAILLWTFLGLSPRIVSVIFVGCMFKGGMGMIIDVHFQFYNLMPNRTVRQTSMPTVGGWCCPRLVVCLHSLLVLNVTCEEDWIVLVFAPLEWFAFSVKMPEEFSLSSKFTNLIRQYVVM